MLESAAHAEPHMAAAIHQMWISAGQRDAAQIVRVGNLAGVGGFVRPPGSPPDGRYAPLANAPDPNHDVVSIGC